VKGKKHFICNKAFKAVELHPNGKVCPCAPDWNNGFSFGNLFRQGSTFDNIWNSEATKAFRRSVLSGEYKYCNLEMCMSREHLTDEFAQEIGLQEDGTVLKFPEHILCCHDQACNVRCVICRDKIIQNPERRVRLLDAIINTHLLPAMKDAKEVSMSGEGELFASRHARKLAKEIARKYPDIKFNIYTNGILCNEKNCRELEILDRISWLRVSVHAATKETYDKVVIDGNWEKVWENIKWLSEMKKAGRINDVLLGFVVSSLNYKEMKPFLERAIELDIKAEFWEFRPWGSDIAKEREKYAVYFPYHEEYPQLAEILKDEIFDHPYCSMDGVLNDIRKDKHSYIL
jgi:MoaA/NifB/PqqE/SkfB family radical SAM enzyme